MAIKNKFKQIIKNPLYIFAVLLIIVIIGFAISFFYKSFTKFYIKPTTGFSILILISMIMYIIYKYLYTIINKFKNKKIIMPLLMILLIIIFWISIFYIKYSVNYMLRNVVVLLIYITCVICVPVIILGFSILTNSKYKIAKIVISLLFLIYIYVINYQFLIFSAKEIIITFSNNSFVELLKKEVKDEVDISYLEIYAQKYAKNGYLNKYDISQILDLTDKKSKEMNIFYKDEMSNIDMQTTNKNDEEMKTLKNILKAEYYKYYYEQEDEQIKIYIDRYMIEETRKKEKNDDIIIKGTKHIEIINCIDKYGTDEESRNFCFINEIKTEKAEEDKILNSFNILFAYDENSQNYIPIIEDINECKFIEFYKIYSRAIEITLKKGTELKNTDYTIRINRYNKDLQILNNIITDNLYYYEYEPVVTKMEDSEGRVVLEMKFNRDYTRKELKNIEIIFGRE